MWSHGRLWRTKTKQKLFIERWYLLEISWQRDEGLMTYIDGELAGAQFQAQNAVLEQRELVGLKMGGQALLDELKMWNAKLSLVKSTGAINRADDREHMLMVSNTLKLFPV